MSAVEAWGAVLPGSPEAVRTVERRVGVSAVSVVSVPEGGIGENVRTWFERFVLTMSGDDLDKLTLFTLHTHLVKETYTTPRLLLDSPVPESGKTTTLEHLYHLCLDPVQMASLGSPALLTRMLDDRMRTILIDEADRSLAPTKEGVGDLIAVLNSGYKRGATRPVLVAAPGGSWESREMPTFAPVVMAGNSPDLPDDTASRCIRILLMPDRDGVIEESDWEYIEDEAAALKAEIEAWADAVRDDVRVARPVLPESVKGRSRERWSPLKRVADALGGRWPEAVDRMAAEDVEALRQLREDEIVTAKPHVILLDHLARVWPEGSGFVSTRSLIEWLVHESPDTWGENAAKGRTRLTAQRLGRMLSKNYNVLSTRIEHSGARGYTLSSLIPVFRRMGVTPPSGTDTTDTADTPTRRTEP